MTAVEERTVAKAVHGDGTRQNLHETLAVALAYCGVATLFVAAGFLQSP